MRFSSESRAEAPPLGRYLVAVSTEKFLARFSPAWTRTLAAIEKICVPLGMLLGFLLIEFSVAQQ